MIHSSRMSRLRCFRSRVAYASAWSSDSFARLTSLNLPDPVTPTRFWVPLWVFIFGTLASLSCWRRLDRRLGGGRRGGDGLDGGLGRFRDGSHRSPLGRFRGGSLPS